MSTHGHVVTFAEQKYARMLLQYLHDHYSRAINVNDPYLIEAVVAWFKVASGGDKFKFNNPFAITVATPHYGPYGTHWITNDLLHFKSVQAGIEAAAKQLIAWAKSGPNKQWIGGALNALKTGGNTGAGNFLVWMALSSWSPTNYGVSSFADATDQKKNLLLKMYLSFAGIEQRTVVKKKVLPQTRMLPPQPPRDLNAPIVVRAYIDPYEARRFYEARHRSIPLLDEA